MDISVKADIAAATKDLHLLERKLIPRATRNALRDTARDAAFHSRKMAKRLLHRPIGYTTSGILYEQTKTGQLVATVYINEWPDKGTAQAKYLLAQIKGGKRAAKPSEKAFRRAGVLPAGKYIVPMPGQRDANGNVKRGVMQAIMSQLKSFSEQGYNANATGKSMRRKRTKYFLIPEVGVFTRYYGNTYPVLLFVDEPNYKIRFPFNRIVERRARQRFPHFMKREVDYHLRKLSGGSK